MDLWKQNAIRVQRYENESKPQPQLYLKHEQQEIKRATERKTTVAADTVAAAKAKDRAAAGKSQSIV